MKLIKKLYGVVYLSTVILSVLALSCNPLKQAQKKDAKATATLNKVASDYPLKVVAKAIDISPSLISSGRDSIIIVDSSAHVEALRFYINQNMDQRRIIDNLKKVDRKTDSLSQLNDCYSIIDTMQSQIDKLSNLPPVVTTKKYIDSIPDTRQIKLMADQASKLIDTNMQLLKDKTEAVTYGKQQHGNAVLRWWLLIIAGIIILLLTILYFKK